MKIYIKKYRLRKGLSLIKLSELSGVSKSFISEVESGTKDISLHNLIKIAKALGVSSKDLYDE